MFIFYFIFALPGWLQRDNGKTSDALLFLCEIEKKKKTKKSGPKI